MKTMMVKTNNGPMDVEVLRENDILAVHRAAHNNRLYSITLKTVGLAVMTDIRRKEDAYKAFRLLSMLHYKALGKIDQQAVDSAAPSVLNLRDAIAPIAAVVRMSYVPRYWRQEV